MQRTLVRCRREVILCAGTINTTRLMQLAGIGDGAVLSKAGIDTRHHLPGVGKNFRDHYFIHINQRMKNGVLSLNQQAKGWRLWRRGAEVAGRDPEHPLSQSIRGLCVLQVACFGRQAGPAVHFTPGSYKPGHVYDSGRFPCGNLRVQPAPA
ncbi:GMC family oxidoreductase N-terminal domain-containing protein [Mesorhizobium atlanticum]